MPLYFFIFVPVVAVIFLLIINESYFSERRRINQRYFDKMRRIDEYYFNEMLRINERYYNESCLINQQFFTQLLLATCIYATPLTYTGNKFTSPELSNDTSNKNSSDR